MYNLDPIGFFHAKEDEKYAVSRQSGVIKGNTGEIILNPGCNFEAALEDLDGFDRIFVIYRFDRNNSWKPKVLPPRGEKKRGVFATRSPHRPNFLGLSCLELVKITGLTLHVKNHDLIDGTPIFDIKPYIVYADSFPNAKQGWLLDLEPQVEYRINWNDESSCKRDFLENVLKVPIIANITPRLSIHPFPKKQNRICSLENSYYEIAYKTWRVKFSVDETEITVCDIYSGYDAETLRGEKACPYGDLKTHLHFNTFLSGQELS
jgi:tRNA-Thr(GGU) m(6)t(6)A37 methyltransferase TsaA